MHTLARRLRAFARGDHDRTPVSLNVSHEQESDLHRALASLVERTSLATVVHGLAQVAQQKFATAHDPGTGRAWQRAERQLREVADRVGAMPDPL